MQPLLILHGAIGSSAQLHPVAEILKQSHRVLSFDFPGHGGKASPPSFSIPVFAEAVLRFLDEKNILSVNIFGYSMGGYVAMFLAKNHPSRVSRVITLATKFAWDESIADKEIKMLQPELIEQKLPSFAAALQHRHAPQDWKQLLQKTSVMLRDLGRDNLLKPEDFAAIETRCLVMVGDRDKMVSLDETLAVSGKLPRAQLAVLPGTPHPIENADPEMVCQHVNRFLALP